MAFKYVSMAITNGVKNGYRGFLAIKLVDFLNESAKYVNFADTC